MSATFPHPCNHCGLCCIATVCPVGQTLMRIPAQGPCPALEWSPENPDQSRCGLITRPEHYLSPAAIRAVRHHPQPLSEALGSGQGCCIAARVIVQGQTHDFASRPSETKITHVRHLLANPQSLISNPSAH